MLMIVSLCCLLSATSAQSYLGSGTVESRKPPAEISKQKCREYAKYVYEYLPSRILQPENNDATLKRPTCGAFDDLLIQDYTRAQIREFPHQAIIGYEADPGEIAWLCAGSLISENYVMTAGHCLFTRTNGNPKYVKMGILRFNDTSNMQMRKVAQIIKHPEYRPTSFYNDIGLLKLETAFNLNGYVRPACLFTAFNIPAEKAIISGWGRLDYTDATLSENLVKFTLDLLDTEKCKEFYKSDSGTRKLKNGIQGDVQMCAGFRERTGVTYVGQGGAPLQIFHPESPCMYDIIGVTSFGKAWLGLYPEVYARVSAYVPWIESVVWA